MQWLGDSAGPSSGAVNDRQPGIAEINGPQYPDLIFSHINACYQCGSCSTACPWSLVSEEFSLPRLLLRQAQLGLECSPDLLWLCTDCRQCTTICPREVKIPEIIATARNMAWKQGNVPDGLSSILWSIFWNGNPWSRPPSAKADWTTNLDVPLFDPDIHEYLLFVGCTSSYDARLIRSAQAVVTLLQKASIPFGILGNEEPCCGDAALSLGNRSFSRELMLQAEGALFEKRVKKLIVISPHCYQAFNDRVRQRPLQYPEVVHYTEFICELSKNDSLHFTRPTNEKLTFHDPCLLAKNDCIADASRELIKAVPGMELIEMDRSRKATLCCGGGGGRMWLETDAGHRFSDIRVEEAAQTGAELLVTSCPFCITMLEDSIDSNPAINISVLDISELCLMGLFDDG